MKSILSKAGETLLIIIVVPVILLLVIAVSPMIIWFVLLDLVQKLFIRLRKDPRHTPPKRYQIYANNEYPESNAELREYFDRYITVIKKDCGITADIEIVVEGLDDIDDAKTSSDDEHLVTLSAKLHTNQGAATLKMEAVHIGNEIFTATQDGDIAPYLEVVYTQPDGLRTVFDVSGYDSLEFLVASLNSGQRLSRAGQIWVKLKSNLYIVNYSVKKSDRSDRIGGDYGYRHAFSDTRARKYFYDKR